MQVQSKITEIEKPDKITADYIEEELQKRGLDFLRWSIVEIKNGKMCINVAYEET